MLGGSDVRKSVRLYSRDVYLVLGGTGVGGSPTKVVRAEQQLVSSAYTTKYYICIRFPNMPIYMHNLSPLRIKISSKGLFP